MPTFIIRNQGFFYTDEYYAPGEVFRQVIKRTFETRAEAAQELAVFVRKWVRSEPIGNYVFDNRAAEEAVFAYLREIWPEEFEDHKYLFDAEIPKAATDDQVDELVKRMGVTFAEVLEVEDAPNPKKRRYDDELHFGPRDDDSDDDDDDADEEDEYEDEDAPQEYRDGDPVPDGFQIAVNPFTGVKMLMRKR